MRRPLVGLCLAFCLGILFANYIKVPFLSLYILTCLCFILSLVFFKGKISFVIFIISTTFLLSAGLLINSSILPTCHIARFTPSKGKVVSIKGIIDTDPTIKINKVVFILKAEKLWQDKIQKKVCGKVLVRTHTKEKFFYGEELILTGLLYRPINFAISERLNYRDYLYRQNIYSLLSVRENSQIIRLGANRGNPIKAFAFFIKHKIERVISKNLSPLSASLLNAMLLGERKTIPDSINQSLIRSGTVHILAVSGLHVGIVAFIFLVFFKAVGIHQKARYIITMPLLVVYTILTGAHPSAVRAMIMALFFLFGYIIEREVNIYNSLSLAALLILSFNPWQLFDIGFQLSFLSVLSIVWLSPKIKIFFPLKIYKINWARFLIVAFSVSCAAWIGTAGLIAYYFRIFSPVTILANMIIVPFMPIIIALGFTLAISGILFPNLVSIFAATSDLSLLGLTKVNSGLVALPGAYFNLPSISIGYVLIYYFLIIFIFNILRRFKLNLIIP